MVQNFRSRLRQNAGASSFGQCARTLTSAVTAPDSITPKRQLRAATEPPDSATCAWNKQSHKSWSTFSPPSPPSSSSATARPWRNGSLSRRNAMVSRSRPWRWTTTRGARASCAAAIPRAARRRDYCIFAEAMRPLLPLPATFKVIHPRAIGR